MSFIYTFNQLENSNIMKKIATLLLSCISILSYAQNYSRVKIISDAAGLKLLGDLGVTVDHGTYKENSQL